MKSIFLFLCSLVIINACKEQPTEADTGQQVTNVVWEQTSLDSLPVQILATSGTSLFAGTSAGVFLSTNSGTNWTAVNSGLKNTEIHSLAVGRSNLFAGTWQGVFHSTNNGASWIEAGLSPSYVFNLVVLGTTLVAYVGMRDGCCGSVFSTTDSGKSWKQVATPDDSGVSSFAVSGSNLFAGSRGIFRSPDYAESWTRISPDTIFANSLIINGAHLYAGGRGVFRSTDNGTSWAAVNTGLTNIVVYTLAISGTNLFAGTEGGVFLTTNNGETWFAVNAGFTHTAVYALVVSGKHVFAGTAKGVFRGTMQ